MRPRQSRSSRGSRSGTAHPRIRGWRTGTPTGTELRIAGLAYATATLGGFWFWAAVTLLRQERLTPLGAWRELRRMPARDPVVRRVFLRGIRQYLARDFHPSRNPTERIARDWLAARGMSLPGATSEAA